MNDIKKHVKYRRGSPINHCGVCVHYQGNSCTQVPGEINPFGMCNKFKSHVNTFGSRLTREEIDAIEAMAAK